MPTRLAYNNIAALNRIEVVFSDSERVLAEWKKYFDAVRQKDAVNAADTMDHRYIDLLFQMALDLGYRNLKQTDILEHYIPQAHIDQYQYDKTLVEAQLLFYQTGAQVNQHVMGGNIALKKYEDRSLDSPKQS